MSILGTRVMRKEDPKFLTVGGTYTDDLDIPGAAYVTYVRSSVAHARITAIDIDEARAAPGVIAVFTAADVTLECRRADGDDAGGDEPPLFGPRHRPLRRRADRRHRHRGALPGRRTPPSWSSSTTSRCRRSSTPTRRLARRRPRSSPSTGPTSRSTCGRPIDDAPLRRLRGRRPPAHRQPAGGALPARGARRPPPGGSRRPADLLVVQPGTARRRSRAGRGTSALDRRAGPGDHPRRRRRVRRQDRLLPRGAARPLAGPPRSAGP